MTEMISWYLLNVILWRTTYIWLKWRSILINFQAHDSIGAYTISCQHGAIGCHGNTVHACVLNHVRNKTQAVLYNSCLMALTHDYTNVEITLVRYLIPLLDCPSSFNSTISD